MSNEPTHGGVILGVTTLAPAYPTTIVLLRYQAAPGGSMVQLGFETLHEARAELAELKQRFKRMRAGIYYYPISNFYVDYEDRT